LYKKLQFIFAFLHHLHILDDRQFFLGEQLDHSMCKTNLFMKQLITLISMCVLATSGLFAQAVVINSPLELAGGYEFAAADFGATLTDDVWTADAVFVNDGTANPTEGCEAPINAADIDGKIALIDRGSCEFGLKCLNAEQAGAIAAIVINNAPGDGAIVMGAGEVGGMVTIPCVMIPYEVGQLIRTALVTQTVNISLGNLEPPPPPANDLAMVNSNVLVPQLGMIPAHQVQAEGDFVFSPGALVENRGVNNATEYTIDLVINHTPTGGSTTEVYNESFSAADSIAAGDTTLIVTFPDFDPFSTGEGVYEYTYSVSSDSVDNANFNNATTGSFYLNDLNLYSKATWDPNTMAPRVIATITLAGGGPIEFMTPLHIPYGENYKIDSILAEVRLGGGLADIGVEAYVYDWDDANDDDFIDEGELSVVGLAFFTFDSDFPDDRVLLKLPVLDLVTFEETGVIIPSNDKNYVVGVRYNSGTEAVGFGFDSSIDYTRTETFKQENETFTDLDYGSLQANAWDDNGVPIIAEIFVFTGGLTSSTGIKLTSLIDTDVKEVAGLDKFTMDVFPNPVATQVNINLEFAEKADFVEYYLTDNNGQVVSKERRTNTTTIEHNQFDVTNLPAGEYHMVIRTNFGLRTGSFIVTH
jgi:hypothetical protein